MRQGRLWFDGASKGNPGPSGAGAVLEAEGRTRPLARALPFQATSNVAEYHGLIEGLRAAAAEGVEDLEVLGDSELVVRQMTGRYAVNAAWLRPLHAEARRLAAGFARVRYKAIPREANAAADAQANLGAEEARARARDLEPFAAWKARAGGG